MHGDYRLDNCMLGDDGRVAAVLDWEICTLGDPLADVGLLMVYWADAGRPVGALSRPDHAVRASSTATRVVERYAAALRVATSTGIDFYIAFGYWKLACIVEGVYARYVGGADGRRPQRLRRVRRPGRTPGRDAAQGGRRGVMP